MTPGNADARPERLHQRTWELLPRYVDGAVGRHERQDIEAHLPTCTACQAELERRRDVAGGVWMTRDRACRPSHDRLPRVPADSHASEVRQPVAQRWQEACRALWRDYRRMLREVSPFIRWGLAVQAVLLLLLMGAIAWQALFS